MGNGIAPPVEGAFMILFGMRGVVVTPLSGSLHSHHPLGVSLLIYTMKPVALGPKPALLITRGLSGELSSNRATYEHSRWEASNKNRPINPRRWV
jgi:hypothetical protein